MKILIASLLILISTLALASPSVYAVNIFSQTCNSAAAGTDVCKSVNSQAASGGNPIIKTLKTVIEVVSWIVGIAAVIILIVSGFQFITNGSDPQGVANARNSLIYALIGVAVVVLAQAIVAFVLDKLLNG